MATTKQQDKKYLAFDYGTKWTGMAVGSELTGGAEALPPLSMENGRADEKQLQKIVDNWQPDGFVLGMPAKPEEAHTNQTETTSPINPINLPKRIHSFAAFLKRKFDKPYYFIDERLSSRVMESNLKSTGAKPSVVQDNLDSLVAQALLCEWLQQRN